MIREARVRNPVAMFAVRDAIPISPVFTVGRRAARSGWRDVRLFIVVIVFRPYLSLAAPALHGEIRFVMEMQCPMPV